MFLKLIHVLLAHFWFINYPKQNRKRGSRIWVLTKFFTLNDFVVLKRYSESSVELIKITILFKLNSNILIVKD